MPTKDRARQPSGRRPPGRNPPKRLAAVSRRRSKHPGLRAAALAARLRPKHSSARSKPGFLAAVGKALGRDHLSNREGMSAHDALGLRRSAGPRS